MSSRERKIYKTFVDGGLVIIAILVGIYFEWNPIDAFIFGAFVWTLINPIPSNIFSITAIFFLAVSPLLLILDKKDQAEDFAIHAYFLIVIAVLMAIKETHQEKNEFELK